MKAPDALEGGTRPRSHRTPSSRGVRTGALAASLGLLLAASSATFVSPAVAAPVTYHVDCVSGSDSDPGTTPDGAWRTLGRANQASLAAGGSLLLRRGCQWTGTLEARWSGSATSPITIGAYGDGDRPLLQNAHENLLITGSYLVIRDLATRADPTGRDAGCENAPTGWRVGFRLMSGADHVTIRDSAATGHYIGILVEEGAHDNRILSNVLRDNRMRDPNLASDAGAVGISLEGDRTEVAWNAVSGSDVCSPHHGRDGSAVEVYGGRDNRIHHNRSTHNNAFTELGNPRSAYNTFAYNEIYSALPAANVLVTRGAGDRYGPVVGTKFHANTALLTGSESYAIQCTAGCGPDILSMRNNIIQANDRVGYADRAFDEGNNLYWRAGGSPKVWFPISSSSRLADPRFRSLSTPDLSLGDGSPAIDAGSLVAVNLGFTTDLDGVVVPQGVAPDIGAHERRTTTAVTTDLVRDSFSRVISGGWGSTSPGGTYTVLGGAEDYAVNGSAGTMDVGAGQSRAADLTRVSAKDAVTGFRFQVNRLATGSGAYAYVALRRSGTTGDEYRLKVRVSPTGEVYLHGTRLTGGNEADLGAEVAAGLEAPAGTRLRVRARVTGSGPATLVAKVWPDGTAEPGSWQYRASDGTSALADAGSVALRAYVSSRSTAGTVRFTFDDWVVSTP